MMLMRRVAVIGVVALALTLAAAACGGKKPPVARPAPPPAVSEPVTAVSRPPAPPEPVAEPVVVPPEPVQEDRIASASLDDLNRNSPLKPVFFELDSSEIDGAAKAALDENGALLKRYPSWAVTIEGHCDERGTAGCIIWRWESAELLPLARITGVSGNFRRPAPHGGRLRERISV